MKPLRFPLAALLVTLLVAVTFAPALRSEFFAVDDGTNITRNPNVPLSSAGLESIWRAPYDGLYIPVTYTIWAGIGLVAMGPRNNLSPAPFHAINWGLHIVNAVLVLLLIRKLLVKFNSSGEPRTSTPCEQDDGLEGNRSQETGSWWPAALCGALFWALQPLQTEAVAWATGFKDVASAFFSLISILGFLSAFGPPGRDARPRTRLLITGASLSFVAALLAKPSAVSVPLVLLIWLVCLKRKAREPFWVLLGWAGIGAIFVVITGRVQTGREQIPIDWWQRPVVAADAFCFYAEKVMWPVNLAMQYGRTPGSVLASGHPGVAALGIALVFLVAIQVYRNQRPMPLLTLGTSLAFLLPVLGFVPFKYQAVCTVADRYAYLALLGPAILLSFVLTRVWGRPVRGRLLSGAVMLGLACFALQSYRQAGYWRDTETMAAHTLDVNPGSWIAKCLLGEAAAERGDLHGALEYYRDAALANPGYAPAYTDGGVALARLGRLDEAKELFLHAVNMATAPPESRSLAEVNLGMIAEMEGDPEQARSYYLAASVLDPGDTHIRDRLTRLGP